MLEEQLAEAQAMREESQSALAQWKEEKYVNIQWQKQG